MGLAYVNVFGVVLFMKVGALDFHVFYRVLGDGDDCKNGSDGCLLRGVCGGFVGVVMQVWLHEVATYWATCFVVYDFATRISLISVRHFEWYKFFCQWKLVVGDPFDGMVLIKKVEIYVMGLGPFVDIWVIHGLLVGGGRDRG